MKKHNTFLILLLLVIFGFVMIPYTKVEAETSTTYYYRTTTRPRYVDEDEFEPNLLIGIVCIASVIGAVILTSLFKVAIKDAESKTDERYLGHFKPIADQFPTGVIMNVLPDFNKEAFLNKAYDMYITIQVARMNFDYETLKKYTTNELYNLYYSQSLAAKRKKEKIVFSDFDLIEAEIVGMEHSDEEISLKVQMVIELVNYTKNGEEEEKDEKKHCCLYELILMKSLDNDINKCPSCGSILKKQNSNICPFCRATVVSEKHDWVLGKMRLIKERQHSE